jgi:uncharacterized protein YkwD
MTSTMPNRSSRSARLRSLLIATIAAMTAAVLLLIANAPTAQAAGCRGEHSRNRTLAARAMFCLLNQERTRRGIPPVRFDGKLAKVAGTQARDMVRFRFTGHDSPKHGGLLQRVKHSGAVSRTRQFWVGENLGWGGTPLPVHRMWMHSPIHKKATLYRHFRRAGVGVVKGQPFAGHRGLTYVITFAG